jgi:hypothetical protein
MAEGRQRRVCAVTLSCTEFTRLADNEKAFLAMVESLTIKQP